MQHCGAQICAESVSSRESFQVGLPVAADGRINLPALMTWLASQSFNEVLFECGATLAGAMLRDALVDELVLYVAPKIMGQAGRALVNVPDLTAMEDVYQLKMTDVRQLGGDLRVTLQR